MTTALWAGVLLTAILGTFLLRHRPALLAVFLGLSIGPLLLDAPATSLVLSTLCLSVLLSQPLYVVLGLVTLVCINFIPETRTIPYSVFPEKIFELADKNVLLAIPFFVLSGNIMAQGGIAKSLVDVARSLTQWLPGGLAVSAIGGCVLFAAISGSSPVTVIAIGGMLYPSLVKSGFGERNSMGLLTSAGSLGIIIPPSIPMIVYGIVVSGRQVIDVGDLFLAGIGPGLLIGGILTVYVVARFLKDSQQRTADITRLMRGLGICLAPAVIALLCRLIWPQLGGWSWVIGGGLYVALAVRVAGAALLRGFWALLLPVFILGGIYGSLFTPTQAAAVSVAYAVVVSVFIEGQLRWRQLPGLAVESTLMMGTLVIIMVISFVFNHFLVEEQVPERAVAMIEAMGLGRIGFLLALNLFLLLVGCFMDIISAILILAPLVVPMAMAPGIEIDPVHLGIIFIVNLEIGYLTPPLGLNLFVATSLFRKPLGEVVKGVLPYMAIMLVGVAAITYIPAIPLGFGQLLRPAAVQTEPSALVDKFDEQGNTTEEPSGKNGSGNGSSGVKSIEELMREASDPGGKTRVKSIEELMREAGGGGGGDRP